MLKHTGKEAYKCGATFPYYFFLYQNYKIFFYGTTEIIIGDKL